MGLKAINVLTKSNLKKILLNQYKLKGNLFDYM